MRTLLMILLMCSVACAATIDTARGPMEINSGDVMGQNSKWTGTIDGLDDVTFHAWNFARQSREQVFTNCTNITLIDCNLVNVEIPEGVGFKLVNCNNLYLREYTDNDILYEEVIHENGDKSISRIERGTIDIVERDFGDEKGFTQQQRDDIKQQYLDNGLTVMRDIDEINFIRKEKAETNEKIKVIDARRYHPDYKFRFDWQK